jgi:hypothetical protein
MSRRSRARKRARQKARLAQLQAIQLPPKRTVSTAQLVELIQAQSSVIKSVLAELESESKSN